MFLLRENAVIFMACICMVYTGGGVVESAGKCQGKPGSLPLRLSLSVALCSPLTKWRRPPFFLPAHFIYYPPAVLLPFCVSLLCSTFSTLLASSAFVSCTRMHVVSFHDIRVQCKERASLFASKNRYDMKIVKVFHLPLLFEL